MRANGTGAAECDGADTPNPAPKLRKGQQRRLAAQARDRAHASVSAAAGGGGGASASGRCAHFIEKKRRYCTQRPGAGKEYCSAHGGQSNPKRKMDGVQPVDGSTHARVPCPIDPTHSVFEHKLQRHLRVCSAAKQQEARRALPFFRAGVNSGCQRPSVAAKVILSSEPTVFAEQVKDLYNTYVGALRAPIHTVGEAKAGADSDTLGQTAAVEHPGEKHTAQHTSILEHMFRVGILPAQRKETGVESAHALPVFVEFGAGRGLLSLALRERIHDAPVMLIERKLQRQKALRRRQGVANARGADDTLRQTERNAAWARLRIDIRDFRLAQSPLIAPSVQLNDTSFNILDGDNEAQHQLPAGCALGGTICDASRGRCVAMSKHLCGVATDLALRCLRNATTDTGAPLAPRHVRISTEQCALCAVRPPSSTQAEGVEEHESTATPATASLPAPARGDGGSAVRVEGVAIALCCHHCMIWSDYVGQEYFERVLGIGQDGFEALRVATSWCTDRAQSWNTATTGVSCSVEIANKIGREPEAQNYVGAQLPDPRCARLNGLSSAERAATGRRCKRLLDAGRLWWLKQPVGVDAIDGNSRAQLGLGMAAELVEYVDEGTSLENCMLLAWPRRV